VKTNRLREYLNRTQPGPVEDTTHLECLLAEVWDHFDSDDGGMTGQKLIGRMESVEWHSPILSFSIERQGGTVLGSTRAECQQWTVNLDRQTSTCERSGHRQLEPMAKRVDVNSIADEIADRILVGNADERLTWLDDEHVRVEVGKVFPGHSGFKQTIQGRRQRFRKALIAKLNPRGWTHRGGNTFGRTPACSRG
jgi:hypothetical protein